MEGFTPDLSDHFVATYHYIRPNNSDGVKGITAAEFVRQVEAIGQNYRIVDWPTFYKLHRTTKGLALITFDDGLADHWEASESLYRMGLRGVFFVPMRVLEKKGGERWCAQHMLHHLAEKLGWEALEAKLKPQIAAYFKERKKDDAREIDWAHINAEAHRLYAYEDEKKRKLKYLFGFVIVPHHARTMLYYADNGMNDCRWYISPEQAVLMRDRGHTIASHGFDHVALGSQSKSCQNADLTNAALSLQKIRCVCGPVCWPFGSYDKDTEVFAKGLGHTMGFSTANRVDAKDVWKQLEIRKGWTSDQSPTTRSSASTSTRIGVTITS